MAEADPRLKTALADRYAIDRELGHGGMATVYLARDPKHDRHCPIVRQRGDRGRMGRRVWQRHLA